MSTTLGGMSTETTAPDRAGLSWRLVDDTAAELGAAPTTRLKWRQPERGVPPAWRIKIAAALMARGVPIALADFDTLPTNPGRLAA